MHVSRQMTKTFEIVHKMGGIVEAFDFKFEGVYFLYKRELVDWFLSSG